MNKQKKTPAYKYMSVCILCGNVCAYIAAYAEIDRRVQNEKDAFIQSLKAFFYSSRELAENTILIKMLNSIRFFYRYTG